MNSNYETAELEQLLSLNAPLENVEARWQRKARQNSNNSMNTSSMSGNGNSNGNNSNNNGNNGGDRFIPNKMNIDIGHFNLTKENSNPNGNNNNGITNSNTNINNNIESTLYKDTLANQLFESSSGDLQSKILSFKSKAPVGNVQQSSNSLRVLYSQNQVGSTVGDGSSANSKKAFRQIPQQPERILDAPDIVDDYYLNLLDWSSQNIIAIPLGQTVYLWNATSSEIHRLFQVEAQNDYITSLQWTKDGNHLAVGTNSCTVQLWDIQNTKKVRELRGHTSRVGALAWNDYILSSGSADTNVFNHDVRVQHHHVSTLSGHSQEVCGLKWSHDGSQLASGGNDNIINIWDINNEAGFETPAHTFEQHTAAVRALSWCPFQPNLLATGGGAADRTIRFWNTQTGACLNTVDTMSQVCSIQWSTTYRELVSSHGYSQNQLCVWKYPSMVKCAELTGHTSRALHTAISPDGETVVSASADETLRFWRVFEKENKIPTGSSNRKKEVSDGSMMRNMNSLIR